MPKNITSVLWEASPPNGLTFDSETGTFSGTSSEPGEYTVPVKVTTNYGSDEKDVSIIVNGAAYPVYAVGSKAETWSEGAEPDVNGFRKLNMPNAYKLIFGQNGFGAKAVDGNYYACGNYDIAKAGNPADAPKTVSKPTIAKATFNGHEKPIEDMRFGRVYVQNLTSPQTYYEYFRYVLKKTKDGRINFVASADYEYQHYVDSQGNTTYHNENTGILQGYTEPVEGECFKLPDVRYMDMQGFTYLVDKGIVKSFIKNKSSATTRWNVNTYTLDFQAKKYFVTSSNGTSTLYAYFTEDNKLMKTRTGSPEEFVYGELKDAWCYNKMAFALTENNELYAKGANSYNQLGLANTSTYSDWEKVGNFDVKRIEMSTNKTFLLTTDGKLYFSGSALTDVVPEAHSEFTQIFPDYNFQDIAYSPTGGTLIVTMEE